MFEWMHLWLELQWSLVFAYNRNLFSYKRDYFKTLICQSIKDKTKKQGGLVCKNLRVSIAILDWPKSVTKNNNAK